MIIRALAWARRERGVAVSVTDKLDDRNRRRPQQERSQRSYDAILAAASDLLAAEGLERFTTNAVAERADLSITAVYRYFPDKYAIMAELYRRSEERRAAQAAPYIERAAQADGDWVSVMRAATMAAAKARVADPDYMALRPMHDAIPELRDANDLIMEASSSRVATTLRRFKPQLSKVRAERAARLIGATLMAALDEATAGGRVQRSYLDEALHMVELYIRDLLAE